MATQVKLGKPSASPESALEDLFARLSAETTSTVEDVIKEEPSDEPQAARFVFQDISNKGRGSPVSKPSASLAIPLTAAWDSREQQSDVAVVALEEAKDMSQADLEQLYLRKAYEYLQALPVGSNVAVQVLKTVSKKLRGSYTPGTSLSAVEVEKLQARFAFAIVKYVKNSDKNTKSITLETAKYILRETKGDMLRLFSKLVDLEYLSLADVDSSAGLCKTLLDILPRAETPTTPLVVEVKPVGTTGTSALEVAARSSATSFIDIPDQASKDPVDRLKAWPAQEKRENRELCYTILS